MGSPQGRTETVVAEPPWVFGLMWIGFPFAGAGVGWLLKAIAGRDIAELRAELARMGVVVREEGKRQHWREIPGSLSG